jgi:ADP-ribose pyrophosphatase YjhB (NUDIX family)
VGHELVLLPAVAAFPWDQHGRLLLVREAHSGLWQTIGGAVEPDESPADAVVREAHEEAGVMLGLDRIRGVAGGPGFRLAYPNGDLVSYVSIMFDARVLSGTPRADGEETTEVAWCTAAQLAELPLTPFTVELFAAAGPPLGPPLGTAGATHAAAASQRPS